MFRNIILALLLAAGPAAAQMDGHEGHDMAPSADDAAAPWNEINERMHQGMMIEFTGDADIDFIRGMIAHHRGAVEMAEYVLEHGDDPEVRALAEEIVATQEAELSRMQEWLTARELE